MATFTDDDLSRIEETHIRGISSEQIVRQFQDRGIKLSEAALRKYVQLGLLPRSRRVGMDGKQRGSQGMYPASIVRQIQRLKSLMETFTIEEIQRGSFFLRVDVEELQSSVEKVLGSLSSAIESSRTEAGVACLVEQELEGARHLAADFLAKVSRVENHLSMRAGFTRRAVS
jgi:hypothetical protein